MIFLSNLRLIGLLTILSIIVGLSLSVYYYKREADRSSQYAELMKDRYRDALAKLESLSEECNRTIKSLQEGCSEKLRIEREEFHKKLRACQQLLERRNRLEKKLRDIDRL